MTKRIDRIAHIQPRKRSWLFSAFHSLSDDYVSLIDSGILFDRDVLDSERERITSLVRRRGFYAFNKENLTYVADSSFRANVVDVEMLLKPHRKLNADGSITEEPHRPYYLNKITVVPDYDPLRSEAENALQLRDTMHAGNIDVVYGPTGHFIRPSVLAKSVYLQPRSFV